MRTVTFLTAQKSLTKSYFVDGRVAPYPLVRDFKSSVLGYDTIQELKEAMELVGESGGCMLKGSLSKEIDFEPRVGLTDANALTDLLVVDYDSDGGFDSIQDLLSEIDPILTDTDYIFQHSASSGITGKAGIRGHVFIMLLTPVSPNVLKQYFKKINLLNERFKKRIKLSRNFMSLCYALDITINQNDKLIYIAPPILGPGLSDPIEQRFYLHTGMHRYFDCQPAVSLEANRIEEHKVIAAMRDKIAMPQRVPKYKMSGDTEMLLNPGICNVSSVMESGKYTRINLSGGDSWAYYYLNDNPEILYNFKGEPAVYLKDIAPEYFAQIQQSAAKTETRPFVFRDLASNVYYNAECDSNTNELICCHVSSRPALNDFMVVRGQPMARNEAIHDWTMMFDPTAQTPVDFLAKTVNTYRPSKYMFADAKPGYFPIIEKVLRHICVDNATYEHFLRWIAHIVQFRTKTQTAWIFGGCEGTGKGTLFHEILSPILGIEQSFMIGQDQTEDQFNSYMRTNMLLFLDEGDIEDSKQADKMLARFRTLITDPTVPVRQMRASPVNMPNFSNLIIATNQMLPIRLTDGDRRYNVAPRQNQKLIISSEEYAQIKGELMNFTGHLKSLSISAIESIDILKSDARNDLMELSKTIADTFMRALIEGDLDYMSEGLRETMPMNDLLYVEYAKTIIKWMQTAGEQINIDSREILTVYQFISGNRDITAKKFAYLSLKYNLKTRPCRRDGILRRGYDINFIDRGYSEWLNRNPKLNVVPLKKLV
jgi:hypothetical protein